MSSFQQHLDAARNTLTNPDPFVSGTLAVDPEALTLYYRDNKATNQARFVNLVEASQDELDDLQSACVAATFGRDNEDVLDESYRKAGKMDLKDFSSNLDIHRSGLLDIVKEVLVDASDSEKVVVAEPYKLNVYGQGAFFKAHKDTPRGDNMFGSLVVVFPTLHQGGALAIRHQDAEWLFDSSKELASVKDSSIGYVAFYSDIEHEVLPVSSGHRVTLTYNLYFGSQESPTSPGVVDSPTVTLKKRLSQLLEDPSFLPSGGLLGFGLNFQYPVEPGKTKFDNLLQNLKGSDNIPKRVCNDLGLQVSLKSIYRDKDQEHSRRLYYDHDGEAIEFMMSVPVNWSRWTVEDSWKHFFTSKSFKEVERIHDFNSKVEYITRVSHFKLPEDKKKVGRKVVATKSKAVAWISDLTSKSKFQSPFLAYGNESSVGFVYCDIALMAAVGPAGDRGNWQAYKGETGEDPSKEKTGEQQAEKGDEGETGA